MLFALGLALASPLLLPSLDGAYAPSSLRFDGDPARLAQTDDCIACHEEAAGHWASSAHANASLNNPWYLQSFRAVRDANGLDAVKHCGGCHDPALLVSDALDAEPEHPLASVGVPCLGCHGVSAADPGGNASVHIDLRELPDPETDVEAHRARMKPELLSSGATCQGCHRGVLLPEMGAPHVLTGFDDWGAWQTSAWAGTAIGRHEPAKDQTCVDCHDHRMAGGRSALAAQTGALDAAQEMLRQAVKVFAPQARVDGEWVTIDAAFAPPAGAEVEVEVVVRNVGAGHRFPGGLADTQDTWVRVHVEGPGFAARLEGPHLRAVPMDASGTPVSEHLPHLVAGGAFDHTVPPGEAQVLRVGFVAPGGPLRVEGRLLHRSHRAELHDAACAVTTPDTLDGCAPQPLTEVARFAPDASGEAFYALALGRSRGQTESLFDALDALDHAAAMGHDPRAVAVVRARVFGQQGRVDDALAALHDLGPAPAVDATRARAYDEVWRWAPAAEAWRRTTRSSPLAVDAWVGLARAEGALGHAEIALDAAQRGLALAPRHPELLRSQALAAQALQHPDTDAAMDAWVAHRPPDDLVALRLDCDRRAPACAERAPIPTQWVAVTSSSSRP